MDKDIVALHKEILLSAMPEESNYLATFRTINKRWAGAISTGMIEAGSMAAEVSNFFNPLIQDMLSTKTKYSQIQEQLVDAILSTSTTCTRPACDLCLRTQTVWWSLPLRLLLNWRNVLSKMECPKDRSSWACRWTRSL